MEQAEQNILVLRQHLQQPGVRSRDLPLICRAILSASLKNARGLALAERVQLLELMQIALRAGRGFFASKIANGDEVADIPKSGVLALASYSSAIALLEESLK